MRIVAILLACLTAAAGAAFAGSVTGAPDQGLEAGPVLRSELAIDPVADTTEDAEVTTTGLPEPEPAPDQVEILLAGLTTDEKIGQLFMPSFFGQDVSDPGEAARQQNRRLFGYETAAEAVSAYHLGGIIYFSTNIDDADQVGELSADFQRIAREQNGIGLLVSVDQEGGRINRLTDGVTVFPSAAVLSGDVDRVREAGYLTGRQVTLQGINVVLAPVADIAATDAEGVIGSRSYGTDPVVVADMVSAAIGGLQEGGVAAAVKHWPGHGPTKVDSHLSLPTLEIDRATWDSNDRIPFEAALDEDVAIVMVGHLVLPALDPQSMPASSSPALINGLLRNDLGFDGVVMTDALEMGAVREFTGNEGQFVVQSIIAGTDILLVPRDLPGSYAAVQAAVASGEISQERLDQSVLRILRLKQDLGLLPDPS
ncbi:MAG: glycoside hydrolase family 3 protein [Actinomycetota bacterium]